MNISEQLKNPLFKLGFDYGFTIKAVWDEFNEDLHPRDEQGKFTEGEGESGGNEVPADFRWGADKYQRAKEYANEYCKARYERNKIGQKLNEMVGTEKYRSIEYNILENQYYSYADTCTDNYQNMAYLLGSYESDKEVMEYFDAQWRREDGDKLMEREYKERDIQSNPPEKLASPLSDEQIIDKLSGADYTNGSCSSLALSYIANKYGGMDVMDKRGGQSKYVFADWDYIKNFAAQEGVTVQNTVVHSGRSEAFAARQAMKSFKEGKTYYCCFGRHAALMKREKGKNYYLEMQRPKKGEEHYIEGRNNGWQKVEKNTFETRFKCSKKVPDGKTGIAVVMDAEKLAQTNIYKDALPYINSKTKEY